MIPAVCQSCQQKCREPACRRYLEWRDRQTEENWMARRRVQRSQKLSRIMSGAYTGKSK